MKNANDPIGNRTRDRPACGAVPQQNTSPRILFRIIGNRKLCVSLLSSTELIKGHD